ncbi:MULTISPECIES: agmatine deiminase family protein [unclassified Bradyrhizobium]
MCERSLNFWARIAPVFAKRGGDTVAIDLNFNGWDGSRTARPGDRLARIHDFDVPVFGVPFVGEGGAFITDGSGLALASRSCLLPRNPDIRSIRLLSSSPHRASYCGLGRLLRSRLRAARRSEVLGYRASARVTGVMSLTVHS